MAKKENKRVLVSCGTKFHADYMSDQLEKHRLLEGVLTSHPASRFLNRVQLSRKKVKFLPPMFGLTYLLEKIKIRPSRLINYLNYHLPVLFDRLAARHIGRSDVTITWAWAGLQTIKNIKAKGGLAIVEECGSCNVYQNRVLEEEYRSLGLAFNHRTPDFIVERELEEVRRADYILCPSNYVARSFDGLGLGAEKFKIIPYGANLDLFYPKPVENKPFSILFVGTVGVRKGLVYLFRALELLNERHPVNCTIIGRVEEQFSSIFQRYAHLFTHIPRVDHHQISDYYNQASVFVFPSLDEGMAYVQLEAMACGLPVICTFNSGGDSVIEDGRDGFLVGVRDPQAIADKIEFLYLNPEQCAEMAANAHAKAKQFTWDAYGNKLAAFIDSI